jgi:hypothetical protein
VPAALPIPDIEPNYIVSGTGQARQQLKSSGQLRPGTDVSDELISFRSGGCGQGGIAAFVNTSGNSGK